MQSEIAVETALPETASPKVSAIWIRSDNEPDLSESLDYYCRAISQLPFSCELVIVLNGFTRARDEIARLLGRITLPARVLQLYRNCDESTAIRLGLDSSHGEWLILLPSYVQSDAGALTRMLAKLADDADYVASWRKSRVDSRWSAFKSRVFNAITRHMTGVDLHDINSGLRVMKAEVHKDLPIYGDLHRFLPILAAMNGFRVTEVETQHVQERVKKGDYAFGVYLRRLLDLLTLFFLFKFTKKPLRFFGLLGSVTAGVGVFVTGALAVERLLGITALVERPLLLFGLLLIVLGVNLISLGLLGELIIFTHGDRLREHNVERIYETNENA